MSHVIRILVADAHSATHVALMHETRGSDLVVLPEYAASWDEVIPHCLKHRPDILLLALEVTPPPAEITLLKLCQQFTDLHVVLLADNHAHTDVSLFMETGIAGYFLKTDDMTCWLTGLRAVASGVRCFSQQASLVGQGKYLIQPQFKEKYGLTEREFEIITFMLAGLEPRQIAAEMKLSYQTIRNHQSSIYKKLGVVGRHELPTVVTGWQQLSV